MMTMETVDLSDANTLNQVTSVNNDNIIEKGPISLDQIRLEEVEERCVLWKRLIFDLIDDFSTILLRFNSFMIFLLAHAFIFDQILWVLVGRCECFNRQTLTSIEKSLNIEEKQKIFLSCVLNEKRGNSKNLSISYSLENWWERRSFTHVLWNNQKMIHWPKKT